MRLLKLVPDNTNIRFLKLRIPFLIVSLLLIAASWALVLTKGINYGVDFAGGQEVQVTFTDMDQAPVADLRTSVEALGYGTPVVQEFGAPNIVSIRVPLPETTEDTPGAATEIGNQVIAEIDKNYENVRADSNQTVSGKVAGEFRESAVIILTIIGYSLNDTIVVYDRVRENLKKYRKMQLAELLDLSINETLARTVMTSLTLLVALIPLLTFGPASLFGLIAAITFGLFVGTYSSVWRVIGAKSACSAARNGKRVRHHCSSS